MKVAMKVFVVAMLFLALGTGTTVAQNGYDLFQQALTKERAEGNLEEAIQLYQRIVQDFARDRALAAKALVQIGQCHEKLGKAEARKVYERVLRDYADQEQQVATARARLAALTRPTRAADRSGLVVRRVWAAPGVYITGVVSRDGRYVTFLDLETRDLVIRDLPTGQNRRLTRNHAPWVESAQHAHISPDGKQVAYTWRNKDGFTELRLIGVDGTDPRILYSHEELTDIDPSDWSPDGKHILTKFFKKGGTRQIGTVSVADGSVSVLKSLNWGSLGGRFSPDGRYIALNFQPHQDSNQNDIFLLASDASWGAPLVKHPADDDLLEWTPDGKAIVFESDRRGTDDLWVLRVADGKPQGSPQLLKKNTGGQSRGMTPNGSLYYAQRVNMSDVYVATLDPGTGQALVPPARVSERFVGNTVSPDWSPDGEYLAYAIRSESGPNRIAIRRVKTGEERYFSHKVIPGLRWSPDGRSILMGTPDEQGRRGLYRMDVQTGHATPIVPGSRGKYPGAAEWSPDGTEIFYIRSRPNDTQIMRRNFQTGHEVEVYGGENAVKPYALAVSPDGQNLAFLAPGVDYRNPTTVQVIPAGGGEPQELFSVKRPESLAPYLLQWTPDGGHLLFGKQRPAEQEDVRPKTELWRISAQGAEPQKLGLVLEGLGSWRLHPDGRRLAFTARQRVQELWVIENFLPELETVR